MNLPSVSLPQGKKPSSELTALMDKNEGLYQTMKHQSSNLDRIAQLEYNMKVLQEQHQATLVALHQEVESLRQKNRDLQFQSVFPEESTYVPSKLSSLENNGTGFLKSEVFKLLKKELRDTKISLQEANIKNQYLSEMIAEQKKFPYLPTKVEDIKTNLSLVEALMKQLRKQHEGDMKEIVTLKAALANLPSGNKGVRSRDSNNRNHSRVSPVTATQEQMTHKFPPLQSQNDCHRKTPKNGRNRHDKQ